MDFKERKAHVRGYLGRLVRIGIDRPIGYVHQKADRTLVYDINYGYIPNVLGGDGEELDVYLLCVDTPVKTYEGRVIAIAHRADDVEDKLVMVPDGVMLSAEEIYSQIEFQEKYYQTKIEICKLQK